MTIGVAIIGGVMWSVRPSAFIRQIANLGCANRNIRTRRASCQLAALGLAHRADVQYFAVQVSKDLTLKAIRSRSLKSTQNLGADTAVDIYSENSGSGKSLSDLLERDDIQAVIIACVVSYMLGTLH